MWNAIELHAKQIICIYIVIFGAATKVDERDIIFIIEFLSKIICLLKHSLGWLWIDSLIRANGSTYATPAHDVILNMYV